MDQDPRIGVRKHYARIAREAPAPQASCCGTSQREAREGSLPVSSRCGCKTGYAASDLASIPAESDLGLGCGNPTAIGTLAPGQTVVDLGSGGGVDCFLASRKVGETGRVIGVDMTPEMIDRARGAAERRGYANVEFRLGEIENLPVANESADVVISNCVINLSPRKDRVFQEAWRILKPGGRMMVSDVVLRAELPPQLKDDLELYAGCVSGAVLQEKYLDMIRAAGFSSVRIVRERGADQMLEPSDEEALLASSKALAPEEARRVARSVVSIELEATK